MDKKSSLIKVYFPCLSDRVFFLCGVLMLCSEIWKQLVLTFTLNHGTYNWWYFPFQLCSIPMYILLAYPWVRRESARRMLGLICEGGGTKAAYSAGVLQCLLDQKIYLPYAAGISAGAAYFLRLRNDTKNILFSRTLSRALPLRPFFHAVILYLACCALAELFNLTLDRYGMINMFYINPHLQMQQVVFRDLVPLIGNLPAILVYITATAAGAFLFFLVWNLLFRIIRR